MIYQILFVLFLWQYFSGEGWIQGRCWLTNFNEPFRINPCRFHNWRWWVENMGLIGAFVVSHYFKIKQWELISLFATVSGLIIYLRFFSYARYNNFWVYSHSKWFGFRKPSIKLQVIIFVVCIILLAVIIL